MDLSNEQKATSIDNSSLIDLSERENNRKKDIQFLKKKILPKTTDDLVPSKPEELEFMFERTAFERLDSMTLQELNAMIQGHFRNDIKQNNHIQRDLKNRGAPDYFTKKTERSESVGEIAQEPRKYRLPSFHSGLRNFVVETASNLAHQSRGIEGFETGSQLALSLKAQVEQAKSRKQLEILRTAFNIDWFQFQQRVRQIIMDVVEPVTHQHEHLKNIMASRIMQRIDDLSKKVRQTSDSVATMRDLSKRVDEFLLKQKQHEDNIYTKVNELKITVETFLSASKDLALRHDGQVLELARVQASFEALRLQTQRSLLEINSVRSSASELQVKLQQKFSDFVDERLEIDIKYERNFREQNTRIENLERMQKELADQYAVMQGAQQINSEKHWNEMTQHRQVVRELASKFGSFKHDQKFAMNQVADHCEAKLLRAQGVLESKMKDHFDEFKKVSESVRVQHLKLVEVALEENNRRQMAQLAEQAQFLEGFRNDVRNDVNESVMRSDKLLSEQMQYTVKLVEFKEKTRAQLKETKDELWERSKDHYSSLGSAHETFLLGCGKRIQSDITKMFSQRLMQIMQIVQQSAQQPAPIPATKIEEQFQKAKVDNTVKQLTKIYDENENIMSDLAKDFVNARGGWQQMLMGPRRDSKIEPKRDHDKSKDKKKKKKSKNKEKSDQVNKEKEDASDNLDKSKRQITITFDKNSNHDKSDKAEGEEPTAAADNADGDENNKDAFGIFDNSKPTDESQSQSDDDSESSDGLNYGFGQVQQGVSKSDLKEVKELIKKLEHEIRENRQYVEQRVTSIQNSVWANTKSIAAQKQYTDQENMQKCNHSSIQPSPAAHNSSSRQKSPAEISQVSNNSILNQQQTKVMPKKNTIRTISKALAADIEEKNKVRKDSTEENLSQLTILLDDSLSYEKDNEDSAEKSKSKDELANRLKKALASKVGQQIHEQFQTAMIKTLKREFGSHKEDQRVINAKFERMIKETMVPFEEVFKELKSLQTSVVIQENRYVDIESKVQSVQKLLMKERVDLEMSFQEQTQAIQINVDQLKSLFQDRLEAQEKSVFKQMKQIDALEAHSKTIDQAVDSHDSKMSKIGKNITADVSQNKKNIAALQKKLETEVKHMNFLIDKVKISMMGVLDVTKTEVKQGQKDMVETFEALIKQKMAQYKTDMQLSFKDINNEIQGTNSQIKSCVDSRKIAVEAHRVTIRNFFFLTESSLVAEANAYQEQLQNELDQVAHYISFLQMRIDESQEAIDNPTKHHQVSIVSARSLSRSDQDSVAEAPGFVSIPSMQNLLQRLEKLKLDQVQGIESIQSFKEHLDKSIQASMQRIFENLDRVEDYKDDLQVQRQDAAMRLFESCNTELYNEFAHLKKKFRVSHQNYTDLHVCFSILVSHAVDLGSHHLAVASRMLGLEQNARQNGTVQDDSKILQAANKSNKKFRKLLGLNNEIIHERSLIEKFAIQQIREPRSDSVTADLTQTSDDKKLRNLHEQSRTSRNQMLAGKRVNSTTLEQPRGSSLFSNDVEQDKSGLKLRIKKYEKTKLMKSRLDKIVIENQSLVNGAKLIKNSSQKFLQGGRDDQMFIGTSIVPYSNRRGYAKLNGVQAETRSEKQLFNHALTTNMGGFISTFKDHHTTQDHHEQVINHSQMLTNVSLGKDKRMLTLDPISIQPFSSTQRAFTHGQPTKNGDTTDNQIVNSHNMTVRAKSKSKGRKRPLADQAGAYQTASIADQVVFEEDAQGTLTEGKTSFTAGVTSASPVVTEYGHEKMNRSIAAQNNAAKSKELTTAMQLPYLNLSQQRVKEH